MEENLREHKIVALDRKKITITAVEDVENFDEEKVTVICDIGTVIVSGGDFKINKLNVDDGILEINGEIDEIKYTDTVKNNSDSGFFSRLFK